MTWKQYMSQKHTTDFQNRMGLYLQVKNDILDSECCVSLAKNTNPVGFLGLWFSPLDRAGVTLSEVPGPSRPPATAFGESSSSNNPDPIRKGPALHHTVRLAFDLHDFPPPQSLAAILSWCLVLSQ